MNRREKIRDEKKRKEKQREEEKRQRDLALSAFTGRVCLFVC
jgi:hypothetical protein